MLVSVAMVSGVAMLKVDVAVQTALVVSVVDVSRDVPELDLHRFLHTGHDRAERNHRLHGGHFRLSGSGDSGVKSGNYRVIGGKFRKVNSKFIKLFGSLKLQPYDLNLKP